MSRSLRRTSLLALFTVVSACSEGRYGLELAFDDTVTPSEVRHIEVLVSEGQCPSPTELLAGVAPTGTIVGGVGVSQSEAGMLPSLGTLEPGTYALYARGFDASCQAIAAGCSVYSVKKDGSRTLTVTLSATTPSSGCTGGVCNDGACALPEGGMVEPDGGASVDACINHPCGVTEYCTDMPGMAPDSESGRTCSALISCSTNQYEFTAPTATSNRVCATCAECSGTQYASTQCANGNIPQNRVCTLLATCGAGQYESTPPTATSNRVCSACNAACPNCNGPNVEDCVECPPDMYSNGVTCLPTTTCSGNQRTQTPPSATTDRVCVACTQCMPGEHATTACAGGNGTQDRICETCTGCNASQYETTACANGNGAQDRVCTPLKNCGADQYQSVAPTATTDRDCATCLQCGDNQRQTTACANGNGTTDRACGTCTACNASQYETGACPNGNSVLDRICTPLTNCGTNERQSVAPTATTNRQCATCAACTANQYETGACANGNTATERTCGTCMTCTSGQYASTQCANASLPVNRMCTACTTCGAGTYASAPCSNGNGALDTTCSTCSSCNPSTQYETIACTSTTNRGCTALTNCSTNFREIVAPTSTSDRQCGMCTTCPSGTTVVTACADGNGTQNRRCSGTCTLVSIADGYVRTNAAATVDAPELRTTENSPANVWVAFLKFNVAGGTCEGGGSIPAGSTITGATLQLRYLAGSSCTCSPGHDVRRVTSAWTEATLPSSVGASVSNTVTATFTMPGSKPATVTATSAQMIADVQSFLDFPANDFGFRLSKTPTSTGSGEYHFGSHRNTTSADRPRLVITYTTN